MRTAAWMLQLCLLGMGPLVSLEAQADTPPVAMFTAVRGEVYVVQGESDKVLAEIGMTLFVGNRIETTSSGMATVVFADESTFALAANTDLTIDDYVFDETRSPKSVTTVENGSFRFMAGKIARKAPENFVIQTETATIGIRGSGGTVETGNGSSGELPYLQVQTVEGHVLVVDTIAGETYVVDDPSVALYVTSDGIGTPLRPDIPSNQEYSTPFPPLAPHNPRVALVISKRLKRQRQRLKKTDSAITKLFEKLHIREVEVDRDKEKASGVPTMMRLAKELKKESVESKSTSKSESTDLKEREIKAVDARESSSSETVMKALGKKHLSKSERKQQV